MMVKEIITEIEKIARKKYDADPALYHNDFKIALYGVYMDVMNGVGDILKAIGRV